MRRLDSIRVGDRIQPVGFRRIAPNSCRITLNSFGKLSNTPEPLLDIGIEN